MDLTPPKWTFISVGFLSPGAEIVLITNENATVNYVVYAIDASNNVWKVSKAIILQYPVSATQIANKSEVAVFYDFASQVINVKSTNELSHIFVYNIFGKKVANTKCSGNIFEIQTTGFV